MRNFILIVYNWAIVWKRQFCRMQALSQFYGCKHYTLLHRDKKTCKKTQDLSNKKSWVGEIVRQRYSISLNLNAYSLSNKHDLSTNFLLRRKPIISLVPCLLQSQQYDDENSCHVWWIGKNFIVPIIKWYLDSRADCSRWFILYFILVSPTQVCYVSEYRINASPSIN